MDFLDLEVAFPKPKKFLEKPKKGILAATGYELKSLVNNKKNLEEKPPLLGGFTKLWFSENCFLAGPFLGAPMAVMLLENLLRTGAEKFIFFGLAGSISKDLNIGDIVLPTGAVSTEGTSAHYPGKIKPDEGLLKSLKREIENYKEGFVWTTDAIYRETKNLILQMQNKGAIAVDMETAALMAASNFRNVKMATVLLISDKIAGGNWQAGFKDKNFKENLSKLAKIIWKVIENE